MIVEYNSNILSSKAQVIVIQYDWVQRVKYEGFAKKVIDKFPYATFGTKANKPGTIELKGNGKDERYILAMYIQSLEKMNFSQEDDLNRYTQFNECLNRIAKIKKLKSIAFPRLEKDWIEYAKMIEKFSKENINIKVYIVCEKSYVDDLNNLKGKNKGENIIKSEEEDIHILTESPNYKAISLFTYTNKIYNSLQKNGWGNPFNNIKVIEKISNFLNEEAEKYTIYPPLCDIYKVFEISKVKDIKVVVIGQDPYHEKEGQAMGIAFSVNDNVVPPPSLKNIYKEIENCGYKVNYRNGNLIPLCKQGVFFINTALTVREKEPTSHAKIWNDEFTPLIMEYLNKNCNPLVVMMFGGYAQKFDKYFDTRHKYIYTSHPSPLGAYKGFIGSKCFSMANDLLKELKRGIIDWTIK